MSYTTPETDTLFLTNLTTSGIAGYETLEKPPLTAGAEVELTQAVASSDGEVLLKAFASPALGVESIPIGDYVFSIYGAVSALDGVSELVGRVYQRTLAGVETELFDFTTGEIEATTDTPTVYTVTYTSSDVIDTAITDRLVLKVYAKTDYATDITVSLFYLGTLYQSRMRLPMMIPKITGGDMLAALYDSDLDGLTSPSSDSAGGGGHTIQDAGVPLTQRTNLNFVNAVLSDDAGNDATVVEFPAFAIPENLSDQCNSTDTVFYTTDIFIADTTLIYLNGLLQLNGTDYTESSDGDFVTMTTPPLTGDTLQVVYNTTAPSGYAGGVSTTVIPTDIYISTSDGSDSTGDGTSDAPYATLDKALIGLPNDITTNCTIHVDDGTYAEGIELRRFRCQAPILLKITGNTTTPSSVQFTGTITDDAGNTTGCLVTGAVNAEIEGLFINVTAVKGIYLQNRATMVMDRVNVDGTISSQGVVVEYFSFLYINGNCTVAGWTVDGFIVLHNSLIRQSSAGTLTVTGPGTSGNGIHIYGNSQFRCNGASGINVTITGVKYGFQLGLNALFQHTTATGTITIDNASKPSSSAAIQCTDISSWSTSQSLVIDNFTNAFEANSISYIEAAGSRTITNVTSTSSSSQSSVVYLP